MHLAPCIPGLLALALLPGCDLGPPDRHERLTLDAADLRTLKIVAGRGDLELVGDPDAVDVRIVAGIHGDDTELRHSRVGDVLELSQACGGWGECAVDWKLVLPAGVAAELDTGSGDVAVTGLTTALRVVTGAGDIHLAGLAGTRVDVESGTGDITGHDLRCAEFRGETGNGELELDLAVRPRSVWWSSGNGDATLTLPGGDYRLDVETGLGDIDITGLRRDAASDAAVHVHTGLGDIDIAGAGPGR